ncbi:MAG TPA: NAD(P)/FAD-dependent oxidoreductase [Solirubrobacteraceae bacterium]|nr:NAD(P)/FAD-dependent oxidoreductase [Solirubrobacteraceae bacterium]
MSGARREPAGPRGRGGPGRASTEASWSPECASATGSWGPGRPAEHDAVVVGAGPSGLATAAVLARHGIAAVILDAGSTPGARWRERYPALRLNTVRALSGMPGRRIPRRCGRYPSLGDYVAYLDDYARRKRLDVRVRTAVSRIDAAPDGRWALQTSGGPLLTLAVIVATGYNAVAVMPDWPGRETFRGTLLHAEQYRSPEPYLGREVLVVGAGVSGIDIAGLLVRAGVSVSLSMRTAPNILPRQWLGLPLQPGGIVSERLPAALGDVSGFALQRMIWGDLTAYGIPRAPEGVETAHRRTLRFAAVDDGFVAALKAGRTRVIAPIARLEAQTALLSDASRVRADAVICATGYRPGLEPLVGHLGVLDGRGLPLHCRDPQHAPVAGLHFVGFWPSNGGHLRACAAQARRVGAAVARALGARR